MSRSVKPVRRGPDRYSAWMAYMSCFSSTWEQIMWAARWLPWKHSAPYRDSVCAWKLCKRGTCPKGVRKGRQGEARGGLGQDDDWNMLWYEGWSATQSGTWAGT